MSGRRKGPARPLWDLWKFTCEAWDRSKGIAWEHPTTNTHRTH